MMIDTIIGTQWAEKVPAAIPVYNIAEIRSVGLFGEGVYAVSNWLAEYRKSGQNKDLFRVSS